MTTAEPARLQSVCPDCCTPFEREDGRARCFECMPRRRDSEQKTKAPTSERGYGWRWRMLSERARAMQPFCSDCGATSDLTTDHTPEAWLRAAAGKVIRLQDIDVVCRRCNTDRGAARGPNATEHHSAGRLHRLVGQCPVCRAAIRPTTRGNVPGHDDKIGRPCPMAGERFPRQ